jgi:hypothetical protein
MKVKNVLCRKRTNIALKMTFTGLFAVAAALYFLGATPAYAQNGPPLNPKDAPGGLPQCQDELAMCTEDLAMSAAALAMCTEDLEMSAAALDLCETELADKAFVEKTGQTKIYLPGDDGDLQAGVARKGPRFEDNNNGTITDKLTNLIWTIEAGQGLPFGVTWPEALIICNLLADNGGELADGSEVGDWHLPNVKELESLIHYGVYDPAVPDTLGTGKWSQGDPFNNVQSDLYWSSSTLAAPPPADANAWEVSLRDGGVDRNVKDKRFGFVWCVRGGR